MNNQAVANLIVSNKTKQIYSIIEGGRSEGMQTFDQALFELYESGLVTYQDALRAADSSNDLRLDIKLNSKLSAPEEVLIENASSASSFSLKQEE